MSPRCCVLTAFLALAAPVNAAVYTPAPVAVSSNVCGLLPSGGFLTPGQSITSCNGTYTLVFQGDGNVVLYRGVGIIANALWSTGTYGKSSAIFIMQGDGNLVLYKPGATAAANALWASSELGGLFGEPGELAVQDDGNLVIYATVDNFVLWTSRTYTPLYTPITEDASYKLTFDEEFNGTSIDKTKWQVTFDGNPDHTYPTYYPACFENSTNLKVTGGYANLAVTPGAAPCNYHTAAITTNFLQKYGYWEARLKVPANAHGIGMRFWNDSYNWQFPEIDILEWVDGWTTGGPDCYSTSFDDINGNWGTFVHPCGIDQNWHVYGMFWTPTTVTIYLDGVPKNVISKYNTVGLGPMQTILGAGLSTAYDLPIDSSTVFPAIFQVDYVHVYSNASGAVAVTPQANYGGPGYNR